MLLSESGISYGVNEINYYKYWIGDISYDAKLVVFNKLVYFFKLIVSL
jgi:hypothetical protein